jgi:hypothetical protein
MDTITPGSGIIPDNLWTLLAALWTFYEPSMFGFLL